MPRVERKGWILLEVMLALVVLGISAASLAAMLHETTTVLVRSSESERRMASAERLLSRYAVRGNLELAQRIGRWTEDGLGVRISRLSPSLYEILVVQPDGGPVLLETALYRPIHDEGH